MHYKGRCVDDLDVFSEDICLILGHRYTTAVEVTKVLSLSWENQMLKRKVLLSFAVGGYLENGY